MWISGEWISEEEMASLVAEEIQYRAEEAYHQERLEAHRNGPEGCDCYECSEALFDPVREREDALANENAPMSMHMAEYARNHGALSPEQAWIGMPDGATWERNPSYQGPPVPHPEDYYYEED